MTPESPPALELQAVTRRWRAGILGAANEVTAIAECSLTLRAGEIAAVTGNAGAGKSTLLLVASGRTTPSAGTVRWAGTADPRGARAQLVGARPWEYGFLTVRQALVFHADVLALRGPGFRVPTRFTPLLRRVGLLGMARVRLGQLSAVDKFRLVVAQALLTRPRLLCCDEPFGLCGPAEREAAALLLRSLALEGLAVLVAARDAQAIRGLEFADRLHRLEAGRLLDPLPLRQTVLELSVPRLDDALRRLLPRLPSLARRGHRLRVPLRGTSPEEVLALCRDAGVAVRASRVAEVPLPRAKPPR